MRTRIPANHFLSAIDKNGEIDPLSFPTFHKELLTQNYWNAGDDLGRIRVVLSEGFPRESTALPYERIKSVVAFSFQHAPLGMVIFLPLSRYMFTREKNVG